MMTEKKIIEKNPLGIDIGTGSIKLVQLNPVGKGYKIYKNAQATIPASISKNAEKLDLFIADTIKTLFTKGGFKKTKVSLCFPASDVCVRSFTIPSISKEEKDSLPETVKWASKRYIAQPLEEMTLAYVLAGEIDEGKVKKTKIVLAAVQKGIFKRYVDIVKKAGLEVSVAVASCFAVGNVLLEDENAKGKAVAVVDIGYESTDITIFNNGEMVFTRNIHDGDKALNEAIKVQFMLSEKKIDLKPEQIVEFKQKIGVILVDKGESFQGLKVTELAKTITDHTDRIIRELQLSTSHYRQLSHGSRIEEIVLTGGGSALKNIEKVVSEKTNTAASIMKASDSLSLKSTVEFNAFSVAIGCALESGSNPNLVENIDKISQEKFLRIRRLIQKVVINASLFVFFVSSILGLFCWYYNSRVVHFRKKMSNLQSESQQIQGIKSKMAKLSIRKGLLEAFSFPEDSLLKTFVQLDTILNTRGIFVRRINFTKNADDQNILVLNAEVFRVGNKEPMEALNDFLSDLEQIDVFMRMRPKINKDFSGGPDGSSLYFDIECIFKKSK